MHGFFLKYHSLQGGEVFNIITDLFFQFVIQRNITNQYGIDNFLQSL